MRRDFMPSIGPRLVFLSALLLGVASSAHAQDEPPPNLEALLQRFASSPGFEARFVEEKRIALLAVPMRSEGRIYFAPPGMMMRRVERPDPSEALIAEGRLRMRQGDRVEELAIDENPVLRGFIDSFRAVLAGDRAALERYYEASYSTDGDRWELSLRPRGGPLARFLRSIELRGSGVAIHQMRMVEVNGDETRTTFSDVDTARRFSAAEKRRIFRID